MFSFAVAVRFVVGGKEPRLACGCRCHRTKGVTISYTFFRKSYLKITGGFHCISFCHLRKHLKRIRNLVKGVIGKKGFGKGNLVEIS